jgi:uncharacterized protein (TIGR04222 family)
VQQANNDPHNNDNKDKVMFPFNLPGPQFLLFFVIFALAAFIIVAVVLHRREAAWPLPKLDVSDPYRIACLSGGKVAAMQVAMLSLIDRGIVAVDGNTLETVSGTVDVNRPIEKELVRLVAKGSDADALVRAASGSPACKTYEQELANLRLISGPNVRATRWPAIHVAMALVGAVAGFKIFVALRGGHTNIAILVSLSFIAVALLASLAYKRKTGLGHEFLSTQQTLFKRLKQRADGIKPGGGSADLAILAAVFGMAAVPAMAFPFVAQVMPRPSSGDSGGSSDSGGDSGCGGGGGCGGCGS